MSVIKLSTAAANCWTTWVVERHSSAAKPGHNEKKKGQCPLVGLAMPWGPWVCPLVFSSVLYHFYKKVVFATSHLACKLRLWIYSVYTQTTVLCICYHYFMLILLWACSLLYSLSLTWTGIGLRSLIISCIPFPWFLSKSDLSIPFGIESICYTFLNFYSV